MITEERIIEILKESEVLLEGHFILTSGKHSSQYMQCARILQYPWFAEELASVIVEKYKDDKIDAVIAPAVGGIVIGYEIARQLKVNNYFTEREDGKMTLRRGFKIKKGERVLVAEDVVTTGGSVKEVIELVKEQGGEVVGTCALVDRSMGKADFGTKFVSAYKANVVAYEVDDCPLCKEGKLEAYKPGSRSLK
ncbi:MAG: orotate phosphoribosyltransferase [Lachnospirales bacterium]